MPSHANMQNRALFSRAVAGLVLFTLAAACSSPTAPSPNRLEIVGTAVIGPQQTTEVHAFLVSPNGTRLDVTPRVTWTTSDSAVLTASSGGRITGGAVGEATLRATLDNVSGSTTVIVVPAGTFRLAGIVRGPASASPISGVQVELITASGDVLTAETAGPAGFRFYGVAGHARLRVSRRTFLPYEADIDIHDHLTHDVSLSDFSGSYTLTLSASSRCRAELPEAMRIQTYDATIDQSGTSLRVTLHGPSIFPGWGDSFAGVFGETNDVIFQLDDLEVWPLFVFGRMTGTISAGGVSGLLDGELSTWVMEGGRSNRRVCTAPDHGAVFSR